LGTPASEKEHKSKVFRPAEWVSAVVLVDGKIEGVWEYETRKDQTLVKVSMFATADGKIRNGIAAEAERLEGFIDIKVAVESVEPA
jgi:hypothetical protein